jgi:hypothetical protein
MKINSKISKEAKMVEMKMTKTMEKEIFRKVTLMTLKENNKLVNMNKNMVQVVHTITEKKLLRLNNDNLCNYK